MTEQDVFYVALQHVFDMLTADSDGHVCNYLEYGGVPIRIDHGYSLQDNQNAVPMMNYVIFRDLMVLRDPFVLKKYAKPVASGFQLAIKYISDVRRNWENPEKFLHSVWRGNELANLKRAKFVMANKAFIEGEFKEWVNGLQRLLAAPSLDEKRLRQYFHDFLNKHNVPGGPHSMGIAISTSKDGDSQFRKDVEDLGQ